MPLEELKTRLRTNIIERTKDMVSDPEAITLALKNGLHIRNITWEDAARYKNSSVGPNISDCSIQVLHDSNLHLMPVIRQPNFIDKTGDVNLDHFFVLTGNQSSKNLTRVSLREYLADLPKYLSKPAVGTIKDSLVSERDTHALVSAQACFLPVPKKGKATFNPVIFNYQSRKENPAVLVILATREGTSATIVDNKRDQWQSPQSRTLWGQRLFHNSNGERCALTGERLTDFAANNLGSEAAAEKIAGSGLDTLLLIQVPLKQTPPPKPKYTSRGIGAASCLRSMAGPAAAAACDIEEAVLSHGEVEGPFTELDGLTIERDERFPIRITVQFYKATSMGVVDEKNMKEIADQINRVYADADWVGSLITGGEAVRPTEINYVLG